MRRFIIAGAVAAVAVCVPVHDAEARRGIVPIPCTSDKVVKVADLPTTFRHKSGTKIDLGYVYHGCFSGEWAGYLGGSDKYIPFKSDMVKTVGAFAGLGPSPQAPSVWASAMSHPGQFWAEWLWVAILGMVPFGLVAKARGATTGVAPSDAPGEPAPAFAAARPMPRQHAQAAHSARPVRSARMGDQAGTGFGRRRG